MSEAAFAGAGAEPGIAAWRIENFKPVKQETGKAGRFSEGDSYIILNTYTKGTSSAKSYNIHFWLGKDTTKDESGTAAVLSSLLDEQLGGLAVQYRELQGQESSNFLQLFPSGVQYSAGGVDSGFTHVEKGTYKPRLLHIRGKRNVRVAEVPMSVDSLNSGDCFVLDDGLDLYQWNGKDANRAEKGKALDVTTSIKNELRMGKAMVYIIEQGETGEDAKVFFSKLGVDDPSKAKISASIKASTEALLASPVLYKAEGGSFKEVGKDVLEKSMLASDGVFVLHASGIATVWLGKDVSADDKKEAFNTGTKFQSSKKLPTSTKIEVVKEQLEPPLFKQNFSKWEVEEFRSTIEHAKEQKAQNEVPEVDIGALVAGKTGQAVKEMKVDDGSGTVKVWRVENFELEAWPEEKYGEFLAGDSYVIQYSYRKSGSEKHIVYYWQGRDSSIDEKGTAAALASRVDEELGGMAVQVRVEQNKEPNHFIEIFKGKMVVSLGGLKNEDEGKTGEKGQELYHIKSTGPVDTHAVQVTTSAASLNSGDSFVLVGDEGATVWNGKMSSEEERAFADGIVERLAGGKPVSKITEGEETDTFWEELGGKKDYPKMGDLPPPELPARLFQISDSLTGGMGVVAEEIFQFDQADLDDDDVMLLDTYRELFLWVGRNARENEKKEAVALAKKYLAESCKVSGRAASAPITVINAGLEPPMFTCHFLGWDDTRGAAFVDPYKAKLDALKNQQDEDSQLMKLAKERRKNFVDPLTAKKEAAPPPEPTPPPAPKPKPAPAPAPAPAPPTPPQEPEPEAPKPAEKTYKYTPLKDVFGYEEVKAMRSTDGIDPTRKEDYLTAEEFETVFKTTRDEFKSLPVWKQQRAKKEVGLF